jgi:hypothetical protein
MLDTEKRTSQSTIQKKQEKNQTTPDLKLPNLEIQSLKNKLNINFRKAPADGRTGRRV